MRETPFFTPKPNWEIQVCIPGPEQLVLYRIKEHSVVITVEVTKDEPDHYYVFPIDEDIFTCHVNDVEGLTNAIELTFAKINN